MQELRTAGTAPVETRGSPGGQQLSLTENPGSDKRGGLCEDEQEGEDYPEKFAQKDS